jgi:hypothetical protein
MYECIYCIKRYKFSVSLFQSESDAASTSLLVAAFNGRADKVNPAKTTIGPILSNFFSFLAASFGN